MKKYITCEITKTDKGLSEVVIFPIGKHTVNASTAGEPIELELTIDENVFNVLNTDFKSKKEDEIWSDYNHEEKEASGWLKSLSYDSNKGIVAVVSWTKEAINKIQGESFKYISPSFFIDEDTKDIIELANPAFTLTNNPAFEDIKNYPIQCQKSKKSMDETKIETEVKAEEIKPVEKVDEIKVIAEEKPEDKEEVKTEEPLSKGITDYIEACFSRFKAEIKAEWDNLNKSMSEVNAEQCKIQDSIKVLSEKNKKDILKTIVVAEKNAEMETKPVIDAYKLRIEAEALAKRDNISFSKAWNLIFQAK